MKSDGRNEILKFGDNRDIVSYVKSCYERWKNQPAEICSGIYGDIDAKCEAIFGYMVDHVDYLLDPPGVQYIKSPARLLADGCGDCKSLTMFMSCCLHCAGISHIIRFVNFDGGDQFTHVYPVALDENGKEIILDMCEKDDDGVVLYDYARPYKKKKDFIYYE